MEMKNVLRMPVEFGSSMVPENTTWGEVLSIGVNFETDPEVLKRFIPSKLKLASPLVTVYQNTYKNCNFLAGRGYNYFGVSFEVEGDSNGEIKRGVFLPVCWMNDAFAIIGGREGLGFPKLYADMPDPVRTENGFHCYCTEYGHKLMEVTVEKLTEATEEQKKSASEAMSSGTWFLHKYITSVEGEIEADYISSTSSTLKLDRIYFGQGQAVFHETTWQDAPASSHIITALRSLPILKWGHATVWTGSLGI